MKWEWDTNLLSLLAVKIVHYKKYNGLKHRVIRVILNLNVISIMSNQVFKVKKYFLSEYCFLKIFPTEKKNCYPWICVYHLSRALCVHTHLLFSALFSYLFVCYSCERKIKAINSMYSWIETEIFVWLFWFYSSLIHAQPTHPHPHTYTNTPNRIINRKNA